jgi:hypothetical protein
MRKYSILLFLAFSNFTSLSQSNLNAWLPEKYVQAIEARDTSSDNYLKPVEGFEWYDKKLHILVYRGELRPLRMRKITADGKNKYELFDLSYHGMALNFK